MPAERRPGGLTKRNPNYLDLRDFMHQAREIAYQSRVRPTLGMRVIRTVVAPRLCIQFQWRNYRPPATVTLKSPASAFSLKAMPVLKQRLPPSVVPIGLRDPLPHLPTRRR